MTFNDKVSGHLKTLKLSIISSYLTWAFEINLCDVASQNSILPLKLPNPAKHKSIIVKDILI